MTTWFTSDTHFSHARVLELGDGRPFRDIQEHNEMIVRNWNEVVAHDDVVYHLGDVALGPWPDGLGYVKRLLGHKILVPGNHDRISSVERESRRERFMPDYADAFQEVREEVIELEIRGRSVLASHYPYTGESDGDRADRFAWLRPDPAVGKVLLHGHTHSSERVSFHDGLLQISVGVDAWGFRPVSEFDIIQIIEDNT